MKKCFEFPNKTRYTRKLDAEKAILLLGLKLKIYTCDTCRGWHLSSK